MVSDAVAGGVVRFTRNVPHRNIDAALRFEQWCVSMQRNIHSVFSGVVVFVQSSYYGMAAGSP